MVVVGSCSNPVSVPTLIRYPLTASSVVSDLVTSKALLSCQTSLTLSSSFSSVSRRISDVLWRIEVGMTNLPVCVEVVATHAGGKRERLHRL
jgi:hypothetical protein